MAAPADERRVKAIRERLLEVLAEPQALQLAANRGAAVAE